MDNNPNSGSEPRRRGGAFSALTLEKANQKRRRRALLLAGLLCGGVAAGGAYIVTGFPQVSDFRSGLPLRIGQIGKIEILAHIGDVANPTRLQAEQLRRMPTDARNRIKSWDCFLTTAPVPREVPSSEGIKLEVPWTLLPSSVATTVNAIDPAYGQQLSNWLGIGKPTAEWTFDRLSRSTPSDTTVYYKATGVKAIFAINMFDFLGELGPDYEHQLSTAIASAVKEVIQNVGREGLRKIALPALAGAEFVREKQLVLSYRASFDAVMKGVANAEGNTPSQVILVVWSSLTGRPELAAAVEGLRLAAQRRIPEQSDKVQAVLTGSIIIGIGLGAFISYRIRQTPNKGRVWAVVFALIGIVPATIDFFLLKWLVTVFPVTSYPGFEFVAVGFLAVVLGGFLEQKGNLILGDLKD